jgi:hypothetical protein
MSTLPLPIPAELAERWQARTVELEDGHLGWIGSQWVKHDGIRYRNARVAFTIRTGREPEGNVKADCGLPGCVAPTHVEDEPGRYRNRLAYRALLGLPAPEGACGRGHDQAEYGRIRSDGKASCAACLHPAPDAPRLRLHGDARQQAAKELQARYYAGASLAQLVAETGRTYSYVHHLLETAGTQFRRPGYNAEFHASRWSA